ncbi:MAG: hypothetical protein P9L90_06155 [Candidatus Aadella gelida]|nr:hypothetical protein [Candidatus Aadella gelida]
MGIAFLVALSIHVLCMSAVTIINPKYDGRMKAYTRVDFLGSILRKTAFDIMLEDTGRPLFGAYNDVAENTENLYLEADVERVNPEGYKTGSYFDETLDLLLVEFLAGEKSKPELLRVSGNFILEQIGEKNTASNLDRRVIYRPEKPVIDGTFYGDKDEFKVRVEFLIGPEGKVIRAEPVNTTGFPKIDNIAVNFVKGWLLEPVPEESSVEPQRREVEIVLVSEVPAND